MVVILILMSFYICEKFDEHEDNREDNRDELVNKLIITDKRGSRF